MGELFRLVLLRLRTTRCAVREFMSGSRLRNCVVGALLLAFWLLMFAMFLDAFIFMHKHFRGISDMLLDYLFAFFFLALLVMMTISNAIIAYTSLYRSDETEFLSTLPLRAENTFAYRSGDSAVFGMWGMATLVVPMLLAYGLVFSAPWQYYLFAPLPALLFMALATELGAFFALLVALVAPRRKKALLAGLALACIAAAALWILPFMRQHQTHLLSELGIKSVMDRIAFCQHWALPSRWVSHAILCAGRRDPQQACFLTLLLLSNVLFFALVTYRLAHYHYGRSWQAIQGAGSRRSYRRGWLLDGAAPAALFFLPLMLRQLVLKDLKTFLRDPPQWSQFLLFFGLLALYILNLPQFGLEEMEPYWRSLISLLNLCATCLTLATLTSRFVFPQLSLEGRRIWVTGLLPMRRALILWGKFFFAAAGTFMVSAALITLSDLILGLPLWTLAVHLMVVLCVCCGLNGLGIGLGALYPRMGTDNPSKIVSSFGGTLNLVCSICFITVALAPVVVALHLHTMGEWAGAAFAGRLAAGLAVALCISALCCVVPMLAGARALARMEF